MRKSGLPLFLTLAFALPWLVWFTGIAEAAGLISWHIPDSLAFWLGLTIATYSAAALTGGWPAVRDLLVRLVRVRVQARWYLVAALFTPAIAVAALGVGRLSGALAHLEPMGPGALAALLALNLWLFLLTEETAWRGFLLPRLQARMAPLWAALLVGLIWGVWHIPLFLKPDSFQASIPFAGFMVSILATSVLTSWIFNHARGSVVLVALFHAMTDVTIAVLGVMSSGPVLFWVFVALQCLAAAAVAPSLRTSLVGSRELVWPPDASTQASPGSDRQEAVPG